MTERQFDAVVVGAGVSGSACAGMLARGGLRVALIDARSEERAGARWVNGVPGRVFEAVRIARPDGEELCASGHTFVIASPSASMRVPFEAHDVLEVDMRLLGARMRRDAREAGVEIRFDTPVDRVRIEQGRVRAIESNGRTLRAALFVDASGLPAVLRKAMFPHWPGVDRAHLCTAAQAVFDIADLAGAERFLSREGMRAGDILARTGVAGGFSILNVRVDVAAGRVAVLTGSIQDAPGRPSGTNLLDAFVREQPWVGSRRFGGAGAIPLRRPYARLGAPGLALLGDAGCMTFAAHGSGIATGLEAARTLADVVASHTGDPGDEHVTWRYAAEYHQRHAGVLLAYDVVRRLTQRLSRDDLEQLMATGIVTPSSIRAGLVQTAPPLDVREALQVGRGALRSPRLALRMAREARNVPASLLHGRTYPRECDLRALRRYETRSAAIAGDAPDPVE